MRGGARSDSGGMLLLALLSAGARDPWAFRAGKDRVISAERVLVVVCWTLKFPKVECYVCMYVYVYTNVCAHKLESLVITQCLI